MSRAPKISGCKQSHCQCMRQAEAEAPSAESAPAESEAAAAPAEDKPAAEEPVEENLGDKVCVAW